jgi:hypothetical protein
MIFLKKEELENRVCVYLLYDQDMEICLLSNVGHVRVNMENQNL